MNDTTVLHMLEETNAVMHGHFLLTSGLHSPTYVEKFNVLQQPRYTEALCKEIAARFVNDNVELVVGPMTGGILLAYEVAKNLGTRVLIVEDIVTTGGSVREVLDVVKSEGGVPVGVGLLVDRSGGKVDFGVRTEPLLRLDVEAYKPEECPLCQKGVPLTQRGRTGK